MEFSVENSFLDIKFKCKKYLFSHFFRIFSENTFLFSIFNV